MAKSRIMCLCKFGRADKHIFTLNDNTLETIQNYCNFGIEMSSSGSFNLAEKNMSEKASKVLFKLKDLLSNINLKPGVSLNFVDQLIKPIVLYGSEIWGLDISRYCTEEDNNDIQ